MFALLKNYANSVDLVFNPRAFQLGFEPAALGAIRRIFPAAEIKECNFHFGQSLWRKAQQLGLSRFYHDVEIRRFLRACGALALIPLGAIDDAWMDMNEDAIDPDHPAYMALEAFKEYFVNTWLENENFPRALWNHYRNFGPRTTNHLEGWHNGLNILIRKKHVNIF
ncbi:uncharacterized protein LOC108864146 [Galendromus occidentalis]|uniref:Uncharacterized protein LOC108864146 n=1 Tax=Galendromus occidentalis TaxID=34638 RepID=A0AAJ7L5J1_9ACAR|nr:uncharacterized protein LOC108864146 [Galendromus occidentalis]